MDAKVGLTLGLFLWWALIKVDITNGVDVDSIGPEQIISSREPFKDVSVDLFMFVASGFRDYVF